jgi:NADH dehydrogenase (ubiquinone) 1 alpha subcomplex subunit 5
LFALRIAFREWETFFLGTARRNGGTMSRREGRSGIDHDPIKVDEEEGKKAEGIATNRRGIMAVIAAMVGDDQKLLFELRRRDAWSKAANSTMLRFTRPLLQASKLSTGIYGLAVHPNPLPELAKTYESTLAALSSIPQHAAYRQGAEALTLRKLKIVQDGNEDIAQVEKQLDEGQIEQAISIAKDELGLVSKMKEWKA